MSDINGFKVPLIKSKFTIKKVSKLEKTAIALMEEKESERNVIKRPLMIEETEPLKEEKKILVTNSSMPKECELSEKNLSESLKKPSSSTTTKTSSTKTTSSSTNNKISLSKTPPEPVSVPYTEPKWSEFNDTSGLYSLDVIKQGVRIDEISLKGKSWFVVGRLASCDIQLEHPSISRHHAVLQYKKDVGWQLFDLESTHATLLNKRRVPPHRYMRLYVGHVIKFGGSSRLMVLTGPEEDKEIEGEMKKKVVKEEGVCGWGMVEAEEDDDDGVNPFAVVEDDSAYKDDPKKALKKVYQREDVEGPQFEFEGVGLNRTCRLVLPLDGPNGEALVAEVRVAGSKREAEVVCALEACRLLELHGLLNEVRHESMHKKKRRALEENDFYDEDDDLYLDRTGDVERKRKERIRRVQEKSHDDVRSHKSLLEEMKAVVAELQEFQGRLDVDAELQRKLKEEEEEEDALEMFMKGLKAGGLGVREKMDIKKKLLELKQSKVRLERLIDISKPTPILLAPPPSKSNARSVNVPIQSLTSQITDKMDEEIEKKIEKVDESENIEDKDKISGSESSTNGDKLSEKSDVGDRTHHDSTTSTTIPTTSTTIPTNSTTIPTNSTTNSNNTNTTITLNSTSSSTHSITTTTTSSTTLNTTSTTNSKTSPMTSNINKDINNADKFKKTDTSTDIKESKNEEDTSTNKHNTKTKKIKKSSKKSKLHDERLEADVYSSWLPPSNQSGDGKTTLNKRLGY